MEGDEEEELKQMMRNYQSRGGRLWSKEEAKGGEGEDTLKEKSDPVSGAILCIYVETAGEKFSITCAPENAT